MNVLSRLYRYLRRYKTWALIAFGSMIIFAATQTMLMALIQPLFDEVLTPPSAKQPVVVKHDDSAKQRAIDAVLHRDQPEGHRGFLINGVDRAKHGVDYWWNARPQDKWRKVLIALLIVFVLRAFTSFFSEYAFQKVGLSTVRDLRNELYESIIQQSHRFFSERSTGEMVSRVVSDADAIQAAVSTRQQATAPQRQVDPPAIPMELLGDLAPGRAGADDEHSAWRELVGVAVLVGVELDDAGWQFGAQRGGVRLLIGAGGDDHVVGGDVPARRLEEVGSRSGGPVKGEYGCAGPNRWPERGGPCLDEGEHLARGHEPIRIASGVVEAGEIHLPIRSQERQRIPPLAPPSLGDPSPLQHDVGQTTFLQVVAHRQPGVATANNNGLDPLDGGWIVRH